MFSFSGTSAMTCIENVTLFAGRLGARGSGGGAPTCTLGPVNLGTRPEPHGYLLCQQGIESGVTANIFLAGLCLAQ